MEILAFLAVVCLANGILARDLSSSQEWELYKRTHGKAYATLEEDSLRYARFLVAKSKIDQHNQDERASYKLGLNHLSDWTETELARLKGFKYDPDKLDAWRVETRATDPFLRSIIENSGPVPDQIDWRKVPGRVSPVKDQLSCGSCWAFSATGVLEGQQVVQNFTRHLVPLSEQQLIDCSKLDYGCSGGRPETAMKDIMAMGGLESELDYPYMAQQEEKCLLEEKKIIMRIKGWLDLPQNDELTLKRVVARFGPVSIGIYGEDPFAHYESGILDDVDCYQVLTHAVLIVGYGTDEKQGDYWIVKNSYSDKWGERGYARIRRGTGMCGIGIQSTIPKF